MNDAVFALHPSPAHQVLHVGADREPVLIVDGLLLDPEAIVRWAETGTAFQRQDGDFYPGVRKPLDMAYASAVHARLRELLLSTFGAGGDAAITPLSCVLSLATTPPEALRPIQSVPHFDSVERNRIASVHYLCDERFGGTSFYRHRSTGFDSIDGQRLADYAPRLKREVMEEARRQPGRGLSYIRGDTALFERTASVEAKFNRAIFYRSNLLHSGDIAVDAGLSSDPRSGRLTANTLAVIGAPR
ncbi:DUF6445 family protein [Pseudoduganella albidiflava]|uniref:Uncharacterized protein n=1 Tax=Pseudoduganella albidiflava TaxID=321983 RepID=A0A411WUA0_9BURK|nr:DUF6445 family protein [Pseudoduganella albidiflava]QBI00361.1 hypothetical protein EYF70_05440 [Pseudoduganella albidiflava]GGY53263.1 hypothetical protein GCM10007387_39550 [Pseudoduganella albidiflava]